MLSDIYRSTPQPRVEEALLTEDEVRQRMSDLTRKAVEERARLKDAYINFGRAEAMAQLAISFDEPSALKTEKAKEYLAKAKADKIRLTDAIKEAIIALECEEAKLEYDLAKFDCETTDKDFAKLEKPAQLLSIAFEADLNESARVPTLTGRKPLLITSGFSSHF